MKVVGERQTDKATNETTPLTNNRQQDAAGGIQWRREAWMEGGCGVMEWKLAIGTLTHWTKCNNGNCYFTSVFCENMVLHQSSWPLRAAVKLTIA
ncbi:hypothetical protein EVAR_84472_1 [Eumeta japonica]|uniref:Uncharacterized protein n=1 Tax=Eumeta variegata TaxID=151549 RepID=A0A4C1XAK9_EUMVA|nr:hypothetical protein EVAR_84472_1 [Eumeta japonica]